MLQLILKRGHWKNKNYSLKNGMAVQGFINCK